jgi:hypothetical protein
MADRYVDEDIADMCAFFASATRVNKRKRVPKSNITLESDQSNEEVSSHKNYLTSSSKRKKRDTKIQKSSLNFKTNDLLVH